MHSRSNSHDHLPMTSNVSSNVVPLQAQRSQSPTQQQMMNTSTSTMSSYFITNSLSSSAAGSSIFSLPSLHSASSESSTSSALGGIAVPLPPPPLPAGQLPMSAPMNSFVGVTTPTPSPPPLNVPSHGQQSHTQQQGSYTHHGHSQGHSQGHGHHRNPKELFIGDLSFFCEEIHIIELFNKCCSENASVNGTTGGGGRRVEHCRIMRNDARTKSLMFGFVTMSSEQDAITVSTRLNNTLFMGRYLKVELSDKKQARSNANTNSGRGVINRNEIHVSFVSSFEVDRIIRPTEAFLRHYFQRYGAITDVVIREYTVQQSVNRQEGYGFITFEQVETAAVVARECGSVLLEGIVVNCTLNDRVRSNTTYSQSQSQSQSASQSSGGTGTAGTGIALHASTVTIPSIIPSSTTAGTTTLSSSAPTTIALPPHLRPALGTVGVALDNEEEADHGADREGQHSMGLSTMSSISVPSQDQGITISSTNSLELDLFQVQRSMSWDRDLTGNVANNSTGNGIAYQQYPGMAAINRSHSSSNASVGASASRSHSQSHYSLQSTSSISMSMSTVSMHSLPSMSSLNSHSQTHSQTHSGLQTPSTVDLLHGSRGRITPSASPSSSMVGGDQMMTFEDILAAQARSQQQQQQHYQQHNRRLPLMNQQQPHQQSSSTESFSFDLNDHHHQYQSGSSHGSSPLSIQGIASSATLSAVHANTLPPPIPAPIMPSASTSSNASVGIASVQAPPPFPAPFAQHTMPMASPVAMPEPLPMDTRVPRSQLRAVTRYYPEIGSAFEILLPLTSTATSGVLGPNGLIAEQLPTQSQQSKANTNTNPMGSPALPPYSLSFSRPTNLNTTGPPSVASYVQAAINRGDLNMSMSGLQHDMNSFSLHTSSVTVSDHDQSSVMNSTMDQSALMNDSFSNNSTTDA